MTRSFVITSVLPWPTAGGADLRAWNLVQGLASIGPTSVYGLADRPGRTPGLPGLRRWEASPHLDPAEVGTRHQLMWAAPRGGTRMSDAYHSPATEPLLASALEQDSPDVIVLDALSAGSFLPIVAAHRDAADRPVTVVHNSHNVEALLARQIAEAERVPPLRVLRKVLARDTAVVESDVLAASDALWACSEVDVTGFRVEHDWVGPATVVPNAVDVTAYDEAFTGRTDEPGTGMVFPATFSYAPNEVGARFLLDEVVHLLGDVPLVLAGAGPSPDLIERARGRATVTGRVPDMVPYLAGAAVMVVPLFEGGGTRLKILEGFAAGLPVVATAKAAEGLDAVPGEHLLVAEDAAGFAESVREALEPSTARRLRVAARRRVEQLYSVPAISRVLADALG